MGTHELGWCGEGREGEKGDWSVVRVPEYKETD